MNLWSLATCRSSARWLDELPDTTTQEKVMHAWKHEWGAMRESLFSNMKAAWAVPSREVINDELWLVHWSVDRAIRRDIKSEYKFDIKRGFKRQTSLVAAMAAVAPADGHKSGSTSLPLSGQTKNALVLIASKSRIRREIVSFVVLCRGYQQCKVN